MTSSGSLICLGNSSLSWICIGEQLWKLAAATDAVHADFSTISISTRLEHIGSNAGKAELDVTRSNRENKALADADEHTSTHIDSTFTYIG